MLDMNPEVRALWLEALRSGRYQQGQSWLERDGAFCCLGVLCDLAHKQGIVDKVVDEGWDTIDYGKEFTSSYLPTEVMKWAGLDQCDPVYKFTTVDGDECEVALSGLNDDWGLTFEQIANAIEGKAVDHDQVQ